MLADVKVTWRKLLESYGPILREHAAVRVGESEVMLLAGLGCLFVGLWIWMGLGQAFTACGITLIANAMMNDLMKRRAVKNV